MEDGCIYATGPEDFKELCLHSFFLISYFQNLFFQQSINDSWSWLFLEKFVYHLQIF